jgi:HPt (histidine-containing phosphotransfer) domain-containing protein
MAESAPIDIARLRRTFEDDAVLAELYTMYVEDTGRRIGELRGAVSSGDLDRCRRTGHALKGSSANIGAGVMREIAAELETTDIHDSGSQAAELLGELESEFARIEAFINEFIASAGHVH